MSSGPELQKLVVLLFSSNCLFSADLRVMSYCKHIIGTLLWLNGETLERNVHPPFWETCKVFYQWALFCETKAYYK